MSELSRMPAMNFCAADGRRFERSEPIHDLRSCRRVPTVCFRNFCHALLAALAAWFRPDCRLGCGSKYSQSHSADRRPRNEASALSGCPLYLHTRRQISPKCVKMQTAGITT
jgi:hypothetical protein